MGGAWERPMERAGTPLRQPGFISIAPSQFRTKKPDGPWPHNCPLGLVSC